MNLVAPWRRLRCRRSAMVLALFCVGVLAVSLAGGPASASSDQAAGLSVAVAWGVARGRQVRTQKCGDIASPPSRRGP